MLTETKIVTFLFTLANNPDFKKQVHKMGIKMFCFAQLKTGNVNLHSVEEAISIALKTCIRKDQKSQRKIIVFITGLYLQYKIERAAQVGGSLLKRFGKSWFPHIQDRELRFALKVDQELENYLYNELIKHKENYLSPIAIQSL